MKNYITYKGKDYFFYDIYDNWDTVINTAKKFKMENDKYMIKKSESFWLNKTQYLLYLKNTMPLTNFNMRFKT